MGEESLDSWRRAQERSDYRGRLFGSFVVVLAIIVLVSTGLWALTRGSAKYVPEKNLPHSLPVQELGDRYPHIVVAGHMLDYDAELGSYVFHCNRQPAQWIELVKKEDGDVVWVSRIMATKAPPTYEGKEAIVQP